MYGFARGERRQARALGLLSDGGTISVQVLNEFVNVARRKLGFSWREVHDAVKAIREICTDVLPVTNDMHNAALGLAERYGFQFYDALIAAAALQARCDVLLSEDLQHPQKIETLRIENPFER